MQICLSQLLQQLHQSVGTLAFQRGNVDALLGERHLADQLGGCDRLTSLLLRQHAVLLVQLVQRRLARLRHAFVGLLRRRPWRCELVHVRRLAVLLHRVVAEDPRRPTDARIALILLLLRELSTIRCDVARLIQHDGLRLLERRGDLLATHEGAQMSTNLLVAVVLVAVDDLLWLLIVQWRRRRQEEGRWLETLDGTVKRQNPEAGRHRAVVELEILELLPVWSLIVNVGKRRCERRRRKRRLVEVTHQRRVVDLHIELSNVHVVIWCDYATGRRLVLFLNTDGFLARQVELGRRIVPQLSLQLVQKLIVWDLKDVFRVGSLAAIAQIDERVPQERILFQRSPTAFVRHRQPFRVLADLRQELHHKAAQLVELPTYFVEILWRFKTFVLAQNTFSLRIAARKLIFGQQVRKVFIDFSPLVRRQGHSLLQFVCTLRQQELGLVSSRAFRAQQPMSFVDSSRAKVTSC